MDKMSMAKDSNGNMRMYSAVDDKHEIARCINAMERFSAKIEAAANSVPHMEMVRSGFSGKMVEMMVDPKIHIPHCRMRIKQIEARIAEIS